MRVFICAFVYMFYIYIYIYIYISIVIHRQICFVLSELISVARQYLPVAGIETRLTEIPSQASNHLATRRNQLRSTFLNGYESQLVLFTYIRSNGRRDLNSNTKRLAKALMATRILLRQRTQPYGGRGVYISIVIHRQICFVLSELISVARQYLPVAGIETRLTEIPSQASNHLATRRNQLRSTFLNGYESQLVLFTYIRSNGRRDLNSNTKRLAKALMATRILLRQRTQPYGGRGVYIYIKVCVCVHAYTLPVKSIWRPSKIFISHPKSVTFNETNEVPQCFYLLY